ncbi:Calcium/calmodulin-dependent protein kinase type IV [Cichlidogyrus casuarinus]|uniref:Calcium/calmodulin-dependent protein kinase type IV n=1 Tax=Cichlidogyrus casuarinus TaxID=1844966 RepID=A0ABD2QCC6_9PLAT
MVMEFVPGGDLFSKISTYDYYSEKSAINIIRQILNGVAYLHQAGIVHGDLKPENLMITDNSAEPIVKIADFGLSHLLTEEVQIMAIGGTPQYCAPEVLLKRKFGPEADMWAIGVITFILLTGYEPFEGANDFALYRAILRNKYSFVPFIWDDKSELAKDFISRLLRLDPTERMTAQEALNHPWFDHKSYKIFQVPLTCALDGIKELVHKRKLKAAQLAMLAVQFLEAGTFKTSLAVPPKSFSDFLLRKNMLNQKPEQEEKSAEELPQEDAIAADSMIQTEETRPGIFVSNENEAEEVSGDAIVTNENYGL